MLKELCNEDSGHRRHDLLIVTVKCGNCEARTLIDSGATHNFASADWIRKAELTTIDDGDEFSILLADGRKQTTRAIRTPRIAVSIGEFTWRESFQVIPKISGYDLVLGKPWLSDINPEIIFKDNIMMLNDETKKHNVVALDEDIGGTTQETKNTEPTSSQLSSMSIKEARKELRKGAQLVIIQLSKDGEDLPTDSSWLTNVKIGVDGAKKEEITQLLEKHKKCFPKQLPMRLPPERPVSHEITVEQGSAPPSRPPFRLSQPELDELRKQLESLMNHGFIEPSSSPYGAPVFFVKKSDGSLRLVCDWRPLNKITTKVQACLPNIDDLFDTVRGAQYFSKLDLMSGYHQVRIKQEDIPKTAINTPFGHYQFRVMGFGLTNAPASFTALMNSVLRPFIRVCVVVFLDDILIFSRTWSDHLKHLDEILSALESQELYCKLSKCEFALLVVKFLGHVLTGNSLEPDPDKLKAVKEWPAPTSVTEVRRFLGFTNFFRRFIKDYSAIARPLEELTGKYARFTWGTGQEKAFRELREALLTAPVLKLADVNKPFRVMSDASDSAIGGVLLQQDEGDWHPVAYTSRRLRPEERNYHAMEREILAAIHAIRTWKLYLFKPFELVTDNRGVTFLKSKSGLSKREARWVEFLADFDVTIIHRPGRENIADSLSRLDHSDVDCSREGPEKMFDLAQASKPESFQTADVTTSEPDGQLWSSEVSILLEPDWKQQLVEDYAKDRKMKHLIERLKKNDGLQSSYRWNAKEGQLLLETEGRWRLCIPAGPLRLELLRLCHDNASAGHPGRDRTYSKLSRDFYWPRMGRYVAKYVKTCKVCQLAKGSKTLPFPLQPLPVPSKPWESISVDFITCLPTSSGGNDTILTFVDRLTKQAHFVPTKGCINASGTADLYIENVFRLHGLSQSIVSDRDPRFTSDLYKAIFEKLGVHLSFSTSNHPQTDGQTERTHRTIEQILRTAVNHRQTNWEDLLPASEFAFNDMVQASTCETPFFLNYGHHPISFPDLTASFQAQTSVGDLEWLTKQQDALVIAKDSIRAALDKQTFYADQGRRGVKFKKGEMVLIHRDYFSSSVSRDQPCAKLSPRWLGPFEISEVPTAATVRVKLPVSCRANPVFNVAALKHFHEDREIRPKESPPSPVVDADGHERYIVDAVISQRKYRSKQQYLVKWKGYDDPTWEPEDFLLNEAGVPIVPLQLFLRGE